MGIIFSRPFLRTPIVQVLGWLLTCCLFSPSFTSAEEGKSGLSANRLKLPKGPGSIEGVGEDAELNLNMGTVSYAVPLTLPKGYQDQSPAFALTYSSTSGVSEVGIGWSMSHMHIQRMTSKGLPEYSVDDAFVSAGGGELVLVETRPNEGIYRNRYEGSFIIYHWVNAGDGSEGYWVEERPDGAKAYYGANADGEIVNSARLQGSDGTYRYLLVEEQNVLGHAIQYEYEEWDGRPYPSRVLWAFNDQGVPRYTLELTYEARPDVLSDAKPGREILLTKRLRQALVRVKGVRQKRIELNYASEGQVHGISRLERVTTYGLDDEEPYPIVFRFQYTGTFDPMCEIDPNCLRPKLIALGSLGVDLKAGETDLMDMNGDGLPDAIHTGNAEHEIALMNISQPSPTFSSFVSSETSGAGSSRLSAPDVHLVDLDGDGRSDLIDPLNTRVLWNRGEGDWSLETEVRDSNLPNLSEDANTKFLDVNNDHKIDVIRLDRAGSWWVENLGEGRFASPDQAEVLEGAQGIGFSDDGVQLADINGDGMGDLVQQPRAGTVNYWLNLGWGRFGDACEMGLPVELQDADEQGWEFVDLNGDSLADLVLIAGSDVKVLQNRYRIDIERLNQGQCINRGFENEPILTFNQLDGGQSVPLRTPEISIRFADANGSGSTDILYFDASGRAQALELFPRRANLISRIDNSIGKVIEILYDSTTSHMRRDGGADMWRHRLPHPMLVIDKLIMYDTLSGIRQIQDMHYRHGFFDGEEKQFRGFEEVEVFSYGDPSIEDGKQVHFYNVGVEDRYHKGTELEQRIFSGERLLTIHRKAYGDCDIAGIPQDEALRHPIRYVCQEASESIILEGLSEEEAITTREEMEYDSFGNVVVAKKLGIVNQGGQGCAPCEEGRDPTLIQGEPCGQQCLGDEQFQRTDFIEPGEGTTDRKWILGIPYRERMMGSLESDIYSETLSYYDGEDFVGMELGKLTHGLLKRKEAKKEADSNQYLPGDRLSLDEHGNTREIRDANNHKRRFHYDEDKLLLIAEEVVFDDPGHDPYSLRQELRYDPVLEQAVESTSWMRIENGQSLSDRRSTFYTYDSFGRISSTAKPGDTLQNPTQVFEYELGDPLSRIVTRTRSQRDGDFDMGMVLCSDGMGRTIQTKTKIKNNSYQADGFRTFTSKGQSYKVYQPYLSENSSCDLSPPQNTFFTENSYDGQGRLIRTSLPDEVYFGTRSVVENQYLPLKTISSDAEDTDPQSIHYQTPEKQFFDGLGRIYKIEKLATENDSPILIQYNFDPLSRIGSLKDELGNTQFQYYDLLGRVTETFDPNRGSTFFEYDDANNLVRRRDSRDKITFFEYDENNRMIRKGDVSEPAETQIQWFYDKHPNPEDCDDDFPCNFSEGNVTKVIYPLGDGKRSSKKFGYDERGRNTHFEIVRNKFKYSFSQVYDNTDRVKETIYPGNLVIARQFDHASKLISIDGIVGDIHYDPRGMLLSWRLENNIIGSQSYNERMQLIGIRAVDTENQPILDYAFSLDRRGNLTQIIDSSTVKDPNELENGTFLYDNHYRLSRATLNPETSEEEIISYQFDRVGNMVSKTSSLGQKSKAHIGQLVYGIDSGPHALSQAGDIQFRYDEAGNLLDQNGITHQWNFENQLVKSTLEQGTTTTYAYDENGKRALKFERGERTDYLTSDFEVKDGILSLSVRLSSNRVARISSNALVDQILIDVAPLTLNEENININPDGEIHASDAWVLLMKNQNILANFEFENSRQVSTSQILSSTVKQLLMTDETSVDFFHHNHLGNTVISTDRDGSVLDIASYYPFGQTRNTSLNIQYSFTGQEKDRSTKLSYHTARYLFLGTGTWISPDPAFSKLGQHTYKRSLEALNPYQYVLSNPLSLIDNFGLTEFEIHLRSFAPFVTFGMGFEGDNRGFSTDTSSKTTSRIHTSATIDTDKPDVSGVKTGSSGTSYEVGVGGASIKASKTAKPKGEAIAWPEYGRDGKPLPGHTNAYIGHSGSNPLVPGAPDIDLAASIKIHEQGNIVTFDVTFKGNNFPNGELIIKDKAGNSLVIGAFQTTGGRNTGPFIRLPGQGDMHRAGSILGSTKAVTNSSGNFVGVILGSQIVSVSDYNNFMISLTEGSPTSFPKGIPLVPATEAPKEAPVIIMERH